MSFVVDHGQFGAACRVCPDPNECDACGYCVVGLPSGYDDEWESELYNDESPPERASEA